MGELPLTIRDTVCPPEGVELLDVHRCELLQLHLPDAGNDMAVEGGLMLLVLAMT